MTHSPFPWHTHPQIPTAVFDADGMRIVDPYFAMNPDVAADNAALIAALPKLVEALEASKYTLEKIGRKTSWDTDEAVARIDAALSSARKE